MPFQVCYFHVIWATKNRAPWITPKIETVILAAIGRKSGALNSPIMAMSCVADHMHVVVSISPAVAVAEWVRHVKGFSTHEVNSTVPDLSPRFGWQKGYGVLTLGAKALSSVVNYVAHQKTHHRDGTLEPYLERCEE
jgi:putative transposase